MLGICRHRNATWFDWIGAWFELLNYLLRILTLGFCNLHIRWRGRCVPWRILERQHYCGRIGNHIKWWIIAWIRSLELLLIILTLGYFRFYWCDIFFLFIDKHFHKE